MKAIKGLILFCFLGCTVSACFDAPNFDIVPEISFNKIIFKEKSPANDYDSLILYLNFKDGDGDLGLSSIDSRDQEYPYHDAYYFLADGTGDTTSVTTEVISGYAVIKDDGLASGKLVTNRTRFLPNYSYLPKYDPNQVCLNYTVTSLVVPESLNAVDATYNIIDTLVDQDQSRYFLIDEPLLFRKNPYHYNIVVKFWVLENGVWKEFDWYKEFCIEFSGRFPLLGNGNRPLEGTIRYGMANPSFLNIFNVKRLKLSIQIRDRALHTSKEIYTQDFTLSSI